jgi:hypothetical protein
MPYRALKEFQRYKSLGEKSLARIPDDRLSWQPDPEVNSAVVIVKHLHGNMLSRWTDFLTSDGEKDWRKRDYEFEEEDLTRQELEKLWQEGWECLFKSLEDLKADDIHKTVYIRAEPHSVIEAIHRQLGHYAYHVGQLVTLAKITREGEWKSLSMPRIK